MNKNTEPKNEGMLTKMYVAGLCNWYFHSSMNLPYKTAYKNCTFFYAWRKFHRFYKKKFQERIYI